MGEACALEAAEVEVAATCIVRAFHRHTGLLCSMALLQRIVATLAGNGGVDSLAAVGELVARHCHCNGCGGRDCLAVFVYRHRNEVAATGTYVVLLRDVDCWFVGSVSLAVLVKWAIMPMIQYANYYKGATWDSIAYGLFFYPAQFIYWAACIGGFAICWCRLLAGNPMTTNRQSDWLNLVNCVFSPWRSLAF